MKLRKINKGLFNKSQNIGVQNMEAAIPAAAVSRRLMIGVPIFNFPV